MNDFAVNAIAEQVLSGINLPPCPATLTSIMREAKSPSADFASIAKLINRDVGIVGPLLKLANSPFIGLKSKATSVFQAITVLGMQNTLNLVQNIALRQSMGGGSHNFEKFWERSSLSATIAEKIAVKFPLVSKDSAYITALFHDCGIPILMMKYEDYRKTVMSQCKMGKTICEVEHEMYSTNHAVVGNMLTRNWMLPHQVSKAILHHHDDTLFTSRDESINDEVRTLISIVHMAECIADEHMHVTEKEWATFERGVLNHLEISPQEFAEMKSDLLAHLNGE
ncbi:MAG: HDOD domain-containing protein [Gallionellaceae bacterium]